MKLAVSSIAEFERLTGLSNESRKSAPSYVFVTLTHSPDKEGGTVAGQPCRLLIVRCQAIIVHKGLPLVAEFFSAISAPISIVVGVATGISARYEKWSRVTTVIQGGVYNDTDHTPMGDMLIPETEPVLRQWTQMVRNEKASGNTQDAPPQDGGGEGAADRCEQPVGEEGAQPQGNPPQ